MAKEGKKPYHHGNLYNAFISTGKRLLEEKGLQNLSLRNVSQTLGVSHNAPYRHFKNKADLLKAIAESGFENLSASFLDILKKFPDDPTRQLKEIGLAYLSLAIQYPNVTDLMFGGFTKKESGWLTDPNRSPNASFQLLVKVIENGQQMGVFKKGNPLEFAIAAWSLIHGFSILNTSGFLHEMVSKKNRIKQLGKQLTEILIAGIQH